MIFVKAERVADDGEDLRRDGTGLIPDAEVGGHLPHHLREADGRYRSRGQGAETRDGHGRIARTPIVRG
jgi:hypothetical protein